MVVTGAAAGLVLIGAVFAVAFLPELRARPRKSWVAPPSGRVDDYPYTDPGPSDPG